MTPQELAIARTVIYASLFDYPLTLDQLHDTLIESDLPPNALLATYTASPALQAAIGFRDGFFFPAGRESLIAERRAREVRTRSFLDAHRTLLRLVCTVPFTRMVALSGSVAHLNLDGDGDLDLFIVTRGRHVWTVTLAILVLARLLRRRRILCANFIVADSHLAIDHGDLFTANQVIHLKPIAGADVLDELVAANPFVRAFYPNALKRRARVPIELPPSRVWDGIKRVLETALALPSPAIEVLSRRLYRWHLRRRARSWRSPDQVCLDADYLKLHTQSHRHSVIDRFDRAMDVTLTTLRRSA